mgnify:CR=1 FL=1
MKYCKVKKRKVIVIRRSCLTGRVVWVYQGTSHEAARKAYWRACRKEVERVRKWEEEVRRRQAHYAKLLADMLAELPIDATLSPEQQRAAKELQRQAQEQTECDREFYDHIMEMNRRRDEDRKIRQRMKK